MGQIKAAAMNFKTPFYVIHKNELDDNYKKLTSALEKHWNNYIIGYSYKTNALPWIIKHFDSLGCYAETVSEDEYELAKLVGVTKNKIIYNGPIKTTLINFSNEYKTVGSFSLIFPEMVLSVFTPEAICSTILFTSDISENSCVSKFLVSSYK